MSQPNSSIQTETQLEEMGATVLDLYKQYSSGEFEPLLSAYSDDSVESRMYVEFPPKEELLTELRILTLAAKNQSGYFKLVQTSTDHRWLVQFVNPDSL